MAFFNWNAKYSVGIKEIDSHHMQLVEMLNHLYDAMLQGKGNQEIQQVIDDLINYTSFHFSYEEKLFKQYGYPDAAAHHNEHEALKAKVIEYKEKIQKGQAGTTIMVANFLKDWLTNHILGSDQKYAPFLKSKGLS
jgi:hemerythrin-like metal-binding protein